MISVIEGKIVQALDHCNWQAISLITVKSTGKMYVI
jgi:hypothetical protein